MKKIRKNRRNSGQTIAEYVLIIAIVVIAAIGILGLFSDTIKQKIAGAAKTFGATDADVNSKVDKKAEDQFKELGSDVTVGGG